MQAQTDQEDLRKRAIYQRHCRFHNQSHQAQQQAQTLSQLPAGRERTLADVLLGSTHSDIPQQNSNDDETAEPSNSASVEAQTRHAHYDPTEESRAALQLLHSQPSYSAFQHGRFRVDSFVEEPQHVMPATPRMRNAVLPMPNEVLPPQPQSGDPVGDIQFAPRSNSSRRELNLASRLRRFPSGHFEAVDQPMADVAANEGSDENDSLDEPMPDRLPGTIDGQHEAAASDDVSSQQLSDLNQGVLSSNDGSSESGSARLDQITTFSAFFPQLLHICSTTGILVSRRPKLDDPVNLLKPYDEAFDAVRRILLKEMPISLRLRVFLHHRELADGHEYSLPYGRRLWPLADPVERRRRKQNSRARQQATSSERSTEPSELEMPTEQSWAEESSLVRSISKEPCSGPSSWFKTVLNPTNPSSRQAEPDDGEQFAKDMDISTDTSPNVANSTKAREDESMHDGDEVQYNTSSHGNESNGTGLFAKDMNILTKSSPNVANSSKPCEDVSAVDRREARPNSPLKENIEKSVRFALPNTEESALAQGDASLPRLTEDTPLTPRVANPSPFKESPRSLRVTNPDPPDNSELQESSLEGTMSVDKGHGELLGSEPWTEGDLRALIGGNSNINDTAAATPTVAERLLRIGLDQEAVDRAIENTPGDFDSAVSYITSNRRRKGKAKATPDEDQRNKKEKAKAVPERISEAESEDARTYLLNMGFEAAVVDEAFGLCNDAESALEYLQSKGHRPVVNIASLGRFDRNNGSPAVQGESTEQGRRNGSPRERLLDMGFEADAVDDALELCVNPGNLLSALYHILKQRQRKDEALLIVGVPLKTGTWNPGARERLLTMGFEADAADDALELCNKRGDFDYALDYLASQYQKQDGPVVAYSGSLDDRRRAPALRALDSNTSSAPVPPKALSRAVHHSKTSRPKEQIFDVRILHRFRPGQLTREELQHLLKLIGAIDDLIAEIGRLWGSLGVIGLCMGPYVPHDLPLNYDIHGLCARLAAFSLHHRLQKVIAGANARFDSMLQHSWATPAQRQDSGRAIGGMRFTSRGNLRRAVLEAALASVGIHGVADQGMLSWC